MQSDSENGKFEEFPLLDGVDAEILMHRDVHFGGKFDFMLDYYQNEGRGVRDDFTLERIQTLAEAENKLGQNLAGMLLSGPDAEKVANAKAAYKKLRDLYEIPGLKQKYPLLIADLILAEEKDLQKAIEAVVAEKGAIVPALIELLKSEDFHDPLFPGYGLAPTSAVECLGRIGDKRSLISLFEALGQGDFFDDDLAISAMHAIGEPAKAFLLKVVAGKPWNEDNERAAMALITFKEDPEVAKACLKLLQDLEVRKHIPFATYLILVCEGLKDPLDRDVFKKLAESSDTPKMLLMDMKTIMKSWSPGTPKHNKTEYSG